MALNLKLIKYNLRNAVMEFFAIIIVIGHLPTLKFSRQHILGLNDLSAFVRNEKYCIFAGGLSGVDFDEKPFNRPFKSL